MTTTAQEIFDDVARLRAHLLEFSVRYPDGTCLEKLQRQCSPILLHEVGRESPDAPIGKMLVACDRVLASRTAYEKEAKQLAREHQLRAERGAAFRSIDQVLPEDVLGMVLEYFVTWDLDGLSSVSTAFASAVHGDARFNWRLPQKSSEMSSVALAVRQYQFMLRHGASMRAFSTTQLDEPQLWPRHRMAHVFRALSHSLFHQLTIGPGTLAWQNMLLDLATEAALPCSQIAVAVAAAVAAAADDGDVCLRLGALPALRVLSLGSSYDTRQHAHVTHPDASKNLVKIEPSVSRLVSGFPFAVLQHLVVSFLDVDMSDSSSSVLFPSLKTLTLARQSPTYSLGIDRRIAGEVVRVEPFGLHASMSDPAHAQRVAFHLPCFAKLTVCFVEVTTWDLPYRAPHDPSLPAPPAAVPIHAAPELQIDYDVATRQLPALIACCGTTLTHLALSNVYMPFMLETTAPTEKESLATSQWLTSLDNMARQQQTVHYVTQGCPLAVPSFAHVCRLALRTGNPLVSVHVKCSKPVPYLVCMQQEEEEKKEKDDDASSPLPTLVHIEWEPTQRYSHDNTWHMSASFGFGVDEQCVASGSLDVQLVNHHVTRGLGLVSSCKWTPTDALVASFCRPRESPSEWFATPHAFSQRLACVRILDVTFPNTGMAGLFADRTQFLRLGHLAHLVSLTLAVQQNENTRVAVAAAVTPVVTLDSASLPALAHIHTTCFSVQWTGAVSPQLVNLRVVAGRCRSHHARMNEQDPTPIGLSLVDLSLLESVFVSEVPVANPRQQSRRQQRQFKLGDAANATPTRLEVSECPLLRQLQFTGDGGSIVCTTVQACKNLKHLVLGQTFASDLTLEACPSLSIVLIDNVEQVGVGVGGFDHTLAAGLAAWCLDTSGDFQRLVFAGRKIGLELVERLDHAPASPTNFTLACKPPAMAGAPRPWYHKQLVPLEFQGLDQGRFTTCQKGAPNGFRIVRHRHAVHYAHLPFFCTNPPPTSLFDQVNFASPDRVVTHRHTLASTAIHIYMTGRRETWDARYETETFSDDHVYHTDTEQSRKHDNDQEDEDDD